MVRGLYNVQSMSLASHPRIKIGRTRKTKTTATASKNPLMSSPFGYWWLTGSAFSCVQFLFLPLAKIRRCLCNTDLLAIYLQACTRIQQYLGPCSSCHQLQKATATRAGTIKQKARVNISSRMSKTCCRL